MKYLKNPPSKRSKEKQRNEIEVIKGKEVARWLKIKPNHVNRM
jgi:hypothetical protein